MIEYDFASDFILVRTALGITQVELANILGITNVTLSKYESGRSAPKPIVANALYRLAFENGIDINLLKTRFLEDDAKGKKLLFHGSRSGINGPIDLSHASPTSDFGIGFYAGETLRQAATWINEYAESSVYCFYLDAKGLKKMRFDVNREWVIAVCLYRGYLKQFESHPTLVELRKKIESADYIEAPIADNVMYETMKEFSEGLLTDEQTLHAISANQLGYQFVLKNQLSLDALKPVAKLFLGQDERKKYGAVKEEERKNGISKLRLSRVQYQNKGSYIDGIFS